MDCFCSIDFYPGSVSICFDWTTQILGDTEGHAKPSQTYKMEHFVETVKSFQSFQWQ